MPNRWVCSLIVVFWLATTGWLFWSEVLPDLIPGDAPPYTIDLLDETNLEKTDVLWNVYRDGQKRHQASTNIRVYNGDWVDRQFSDWNWLRHTPDKEIFELSVYFGRDQDAHADLLTRLPSFRSLLLVTARGDLIATQTIAEINQTPRIMLYFSGEVIDGQFHSSYEVPDLHGVSLGGLEKGSLPPTAVSRHGSVLNPLHPVNRIRGLRPGQEWKMPLVDPVQEAFKGSKFNFLLSAPTEKTLRARVLPEIQLLTWKGKPRRCLVIEYEARDLSAHTWVEFTTGLVLQQEATQNDSTLLLERESDIDGLP